jgi:hypothetical protein
MVNIAHFIRKFWLTARIACASKLTALPRKKFQQSEHTQATALRVGPGLEGRLRLVQIAAMSCEFLGCIPIAIPEKLWSV